MTQPHLINPQLVLVCDIGGNLLFQESDGRIDALDIAHILIILFLLAFGHVHADIEAGEALHDLGAGEQGDAFGVAVHDVL